MIQNIDDFIKTFKAARRTSTPLVAVRTADPASSLGAVRRVLGKEWDGTPVVNWDIMRSAIGLSRVGKEQISQLLNGSDPSMLGPAEMLRLAENLRDDAILFFAKGHRFFAYPSVIQGIWNLRDPFKRNGRMLVLLLAPATTLPEEIVQDVLIMEEPLPSAATLAAIVAETIASAELPPIEASTIDRAVDALVGLAAFPAEQVVSMCLSKAGLDTDALWERKRQVIEQTPGLRIWRGGERFNHIGGCENVKRFLGAVVHSSAPPRIVVFIDEIEKAFAGTGTDLSGVKTELTGTILTWMQDREAEGTLFLGPPGAAKSAVAKATGNESGIPTIAFDLTAMQSSLVGSSGERLRTALQIIAAVSHGRSLWIATCNSRGSLPPELRRRFALGTFFFDLPTPDEREAIWRIYLDKYGVDGDLPEDEG